MVNDAREPERQLLEKLLLERDDLDRHISFLRKRLGEPDTESTGVSTSRTTSSVGIQKGEFYGLSRPQAAVAVLKKLGKNLTTNEIFEILKESGYEGLSSKNAFNGLYTALIRSSEITKVAPNTWGLREKYPHLKEKKRIPAMALSDGGIRIVE
jgi:hypothetical protein